MRIFKKLSLRNKTFVIIKLFKNNQNIKNKILYMELVDESLINSVKATILTKPIAWFN